MAEAAISTAKWAGALIEMLIGLRLAKKPIFSIISRDYKYFALCCDIAEIVRPT